MLKKFILGLLAVGFVSGVSAESHAQSPFEFSFGYSLGIQNSFRHRLPAPPYFAVHPPVYYGQRYERPYGESPFASWPLLQPNEEYRPVRASTRVAPPVVIENPYLMEEGFYEGTPVHPESQNVIGDEPLATNDGKRQDAAVSSNVNFRPVVVRNPYVQPMLVSK